MNIAFVNWWTFNTVMGGIEAVGARVAQALIARGHRVCFAAVEEGYPSTEGVDNLLFPDKRNIRGKANRQALEKYFADHHVELIVCHNAYRRRLALLLREVAQTVGAKLVFELHNDPMVYRYKRKTPGLLHGAEYLFQRCKALRQWCLLGRLADRVVVLSPAYVDTFATLSGMPREKVVFISNPNRYPPEEFPEGPLKKDKLVLYVGRFDYGQKRVDRLLRIWKMVQESHPDWSLSLLGGGSGSEERTLRELAGRLRLRRVQFEGVQDPAKYLRRAAILASTSSYEGLPLAILEAMQYGVVPIAFDSYASFSDVTDEGRAGVGVPPFDLSAYATALDSLMTDDPRREEMARQAHAQSARYSMELVVRGWEQLFRSLANDR